jgi:hypothetical protein
VRTDWLSSSAAGGDAPPPPAPAAELAVGEGKRVVDVLPISFLLPAAQIVVGRLPRWQLMWQQPQGKARPQEEGTALRSSRDVALRPPAIPRIRGLERDQLPLTSGQISVVALP